MEATRTDAMRMEGRVDGAEGDEDVVNAAV